MRGPKPKHVVELTTRERQELRQQVSSHTLSQSKVARARILLAAHEHMEWSNQQIAEAVGCTDRTVRKWRRRWVKKRSIEDAPRPGAPRRSRRRRKQ
jgi:transposase